MTAKPDPAQTVRKKPVSKSWTLGMIRDWHSRHRNDYCAHDAAPPAIWTELFAQLLEEVERLTRYDSTDDKQT